MEARMLVLKKYRIPKVCRKSVAGLKCLHSIQLYARTMKHEASH